MFNWRNLFFLLLFVAGAILAGIFYWIPLHEVPRENFAFACDSDNVTWAKESLMRNPFLLRGEHWNCGTALHVACDRNAPKIILYLLSEDVDINAVNKEGKTPLHLLLAKGKRKHSVRLSKALCDEGATVTAKDKLGNTPLYYAKNPELHRQEIDQQVIALLEVESNELEQNEVTLQPKEEMQ